MSAAFKGSVRNRLLLTLLGGVMLIWGVAVFFTSQETRSEMQELLDAHLAQSSALLAAQVSHEVHEIEQEQAENLHVYARDVAFQVWENGRELRLHSANAPSGRLSPLDDGFADVEHGQRQWRVYSLWDTDHVYLIQVGEALDARHHLEGEILEKLVQPLLFSLPLLGMLIWFSIGTALRPLDRIGIALSMRDPNRLEPVESDVPKEVVPLVGRLNGLLARVRTSLENERRFTSDAAHELRTPLAAIKTQLQVAQGAESEPERGRAITNAIAASDRATHLVGQLLTLARLEHDAWQQQLEVVNMHDVAARTLAEMGPMAAEKGVRLALTGISECTLRTHAGLLGVLIRNLVDNAVRYSPTDSEVEVEISRSTQSVDLAVHDQGPGIPASEREHALQRFHRMAGESESGSGLGLSIVARIAELHQAQLLLQDNQNKPGLCALVRFPAG